MGFSIRAVNSMGNDGYHQLSNDPGNFLEFPITMGTAYGSVANYIICTAKEAQSEYPTDITYDGVPYTWMPGGGTGYYAGNAAWQPVGSPSNQVNGAIIAIAEPEVKVIHGDVGEGATLEPADGTDIVDGEVTLSGTVPDDGYQWKLVVDGEQVGPSFVIGFSQLVEDVTESITVDLVQDLPILGGAYASGLLLKLWDIANGGPADWGRFSLPASWSAGSNVLIPPSGSVVIGPGRPPVGIWQKHGVISEDGGALPKGSLSVDVLVDELWSPIDVHVLDGTTSSTGVADCLVLKTLDAINLTGREFRLHYFFDEDSSEPVVGTPQPAPGWVPPSGQSSGGGGGTSWPAPEQPVPPEPPEPGTPPEPPVPPEPDTEECPCSPYYVAIEEGILGINETLQWGTGILSDDLLYLGEELGCLSDNVWEGVKVLDYIDGRIGDTNSILQEMADSLALIADRLPIWVDVDVERNLQVTVTRNPDDEQEYYDGGL